MKKIKAKKFNFQYGGGRKGDIVMMTVDIVAIILTLAFFFGGIMLGFGKTLKLLTGGLVGKILSVVVCYFLFGIVLALPFVQELLNKLITALQEDGSWYCNVLLYIRLDLIVFAVALFIFVQIARRWVVSLIKAVFEINKKPIRVLNKTLGAVAGVVSLFIITLIVFQFLALVGGLDGDFYQSIQGSALGIDKLFRYNPLNSIFDTIVQAIKPE